jgi:sugar lactone lactonase YvrE
MDSQGNFYVAGFSDHRAVAIFDGPSQTEVPWVGRAERTSQGLRRPSAVAVDRSTSPNHLYVVDETSRLVGWRDAAGFANGAPADLVLACAPGGICPANPRVTANVLAVDSRGNLWLSDIGGSRVVELDRPFDTDLVPDRILGQGGCNTGGRSASSLCHPGALAFDRDDNLYVADLGNHRVLLFKTPLRDGVADKVFGQADFRQGQCNRGNGPRPGAASLCLGYEDGGFPSTSFAGSGGVAVDGQGNLFVADSLNHRVLIFKDASRSDSVADAVLGQDGKFNTSLSGTGARRFGGATRDTFALFGPSGLAIGPAGDLYVADPPNDRLLVFVNPLRNDVADRVFGHASFDDHGVASAETGGPPANATRLLRPTALDFDALGNLYVADTFYNRVLAFDRP